jgi:hypothetical protein
MQVGRLADGLAGWPYTSKIPSNQLIQQRLCASLMPDVYDDLFVRV